MSNTKFEETVKEVIIVGKSGTRTLMPNVWMAKSYAKDLWQGDVDRIEVTTVINVTEEDE